MSSTYNAIMGIVEAPEAEQREKAQQGASPAAVADQQQKQTMGDATATADQQKKQNAAGDTAASAEQAKKQDGAPGANGGADGMNGGANGGAGGAGDVAIKVDVGNGVPVGARERLTHQAAKTVGNVALTDPTSTATAVKSATKPVGGGADADEDGEVKYESYEDIFRRLNPQPKTLTDAQKRLAEKKRKRETLLTAIGEGISALSNVYFASQYAPNMYQYNGLTQATQNKWLKWGADYQHRQKEWGEGLARAKAMDAARDKENRDWRLRLAKADYEQRIAAAKEARDAQMHEVNLALELHKIDGAKADADRKRIQAQYEEQAQQAALALSGEKVKTEKSRQYEISTQAQVNKARAAKEGKDWEFDGKHYDTVEEWKAAIAAAADELDIPMLTPKKETVTTTEGNGYTKKTTTKETEKEEYERYEDLVGKIYRKRREKAEEERRKKEEEEKNNSLGIGASQQSSGVSLGVSAK